MEQIFIVATTAANSKCVVPSLNKGCRQERILNMMNTQQRTRTLGFDNRNPIVSNSPGQCMPSSDEHGLPFDDHSPYCPQTCPIPRRAFDASSCCPTRLVSFPDDVGRGTLKFPIPAYMFRCAAPTKAPIEAFPWPTSDPNDLHLKGFQGLAFLRKQSARWLCFHLLTACILVLGY